MDKFIQNITIQNFKSIRQTTMECSRINLIIGQPNVGKSNILEALSLFCARYSIGGQKFLGEFIRYNDLSELFFDQEIDNPISVFTNKDNLSIGLKNEQFLFTIGHKHDVTKVLAPSDIIDSFTPKKIFQLGISSYGEVSNQIVNNYNAPHSIKKYVFRLPEFEKEKSIGPLSPPYGENLFSIILTNSKLKKEIASWLKIYNLDLVLDKRTKSLSVQKREGNIVYPISYNLIADTLQRIIFHYAAIDSNKDAILLFEEPESHSFPPYITELAHKIIEGENNNQYFITTHSPFLFNTIVENTDIADLSVFIANYQNYQTLLKKLSKNDLSELINNGIDIFFNQAYFLNEQS